MSEGEGAFRPRAVAVMIAVGLIGFIGMLVLGAYAPDLRSGRNGGAHALSNAATGYSALVTLAQATGRRTQVVRNTHMLDGDGLVVLTPDSGFTDMTKVMAQREGKATLLILPKWATVADPRHSGWVRHAGLTGADNAERVLAPATKLTVRIVRSGARPMVSHAGKPFGMRFVAPRPLQTFSGKGFEPVLTDHAGRMVLGRSDWLWILSDPDLLDNRGMANARQAEAAMDLLDYIRSNGDDPIRFDVTLNGLGHSPSPLKLAFEPPFLAMTLALAVVLVLVGVQALARFGPAQPRARAIAFGKAALVDNAAALIRRAGREATLGARYAQVIRERAGVAFAAPARLRDAALDTYLDRLGGRGRFSDLAAAADRANDRVALVVAARALHGWFGENRR